MNRNEEKIEKIKGVCKYFYNTIEKTVKYGRLEGQKVSNRVTGVIVKYPHGEDTKYAMGKAMCSHLDQFRKKTGRDMALGRAIQDMEKGVLYEPTPKDLTLFGDTDYVPDTDVDYGNIS